MSLTRRLAAEPDGARWWGNADDFRCALLTGRPTSRRRYGRITWELPSTKGAECWQTWRRRYACVTEAIRRVRAEDRLRVIDWIRVRS